MPIANCPKCQKVFSKAMHLLCPACHRASLEQANQVCQFVENHPNRTLEEIAIACGLSNHELETLLYSGKLGAVAQQMIVHCQSCRHSIPPAATIGRFCPDCAQKLENKPRTIDSPNMPLQKQAIPLKQAPVNPMVQPSELSLPVKEKASPSASFHAKAESVSSRAETYGFKRLL